MKLLKTLIAMSLVNAVVLIAVIGWGTMKPAPSIPIASPSPASRQESILSSSPLPASSSVVRPTPPPSTARPSTHPITPTTATSPQTLPAPAILSPTPTTTPTPPPTPPPTPTPPVDNRCLIMIDGSTYDVTQYRNQHPGGNIFSCGTDMSQIFWGKHNQDTLNKMQRYRI